MKILSQNIFSLCRVSNCTRCEQKWGECGAWTSCWTPYSLVFWYQNFRGTCCLAHSDRNLTLALLRRYQFTKSDGLISRKIVMFILTALQQFCLNYLSIYGSTALMDFGRFFSFLIHTLSVGLLGRGISPSQGRYLHTEEHKHRINAHRYPCLE
jgi:hypothetical protein